MRKREGSACVCKREGDIYIERGGGREGASEIERATERSVAREIDKDIV